MATPKQEEIKVRVTGEMKARVVARAEARGESESVIVREALSAYLLRDETPSPAGTSTVLASSKPVRYKISRKPLKKAS